jgi:hypothetical protein
MRGLFVKRLEIKLSTSFMPGLHASSPFDSLSVRLQVRTIYCSTMAAYKNTSVLLWKTGSHITEFSLTESVMSKILLE